MSDSGQLKRREAAHRGPPHRSDAGAPPQAEARSREAARAVVQEQGTDASLRDIARRADVGLGTLYRHFPTREALLEVLLRSSLDEMTAQAAALETSNAPDEALVTWLREAVAFTKNYHCVTQLLAAALDDPQSALHASCVMRHGALGRRAAPLPCSSQGEGAKRPQR
ncbi:TetR/AcrR family transcriptional regulator [Corallococcus interemptor]|uniref:TetR/AcrR family transcriptional regulator n=1 Tax=Corallococcus interemptor TaxID=2316720 RepID=UPI001FC9ECA4|nr:TetR/AcrR family transcriptional regulator [Corallococcus interemptor]